MGDCVCVCVCVRACVRARARADGGLSSCISPQDSRAGHLSFCTKVCYGIGGIPNQVASSATAFYLQLFLLDVAQVSVDSSTGPPIFLGTHFFHPYLYFTWQMALPSPT